MTTPTTTEPAYGLLAFGTVLRPWAEPAWLESYDPEANEGLGQATFTTDPAKAARFPSFDAAFTTWRAQPKCHPIRSTDGQPNRPLTAFSVMIEKLPELAS